jgi:hypothetical protein
MMGPMSITGDKPSHVTSSYWVYIDAPDRSPDMPTDRVGKWQFFVPRHKVDEVWAKVVDLVRAGGLGPLDKGVDDDGQPELLRRAGRARGHRLRRRLA